MKTQRIFAFLVSSLLALHAAAFAQMERIEPTGTSEAKRLETRSHFNELNGGQIPLKPGKPPAPVHYLWGDINADGLQDLFVLDQEKNLLFRNAGDGGFEDITALAFPDGAGKGGTGFFGDYNGDQLPDLFLFLDEGFILYRNEGKLLFSDVTEILGLPSGMTGVKVRLKDYDQDGFDDLVVESPEGGRIFRNRKGREFGEIVLGNRSRQGSGSGSEGRIPPAQPPGGQSSPDTSTSNSLDASTLFLNDNSPGSAGYGVPEVEGGDDGAVQNDIVDGTVTGADIKSGSVPASRITGTAATLTGNQNFESGTLYFDANNNRMGMGTTKPSSASLHIDSSEDYGCRVENSSTSSSAIYGKGTATTGTVNGVYGDVESTSGKGVYGRARASSGSTYGVRGDSESSTGRGVYGLASATSGENYGVRGHSNSSGGWGVYGTSPSTGVEGLATASSGQTYGVRGQSDSTTGRGVHGTASSTTGMNYGLRGDSYSTTGRGVYGAANASSGANYGVKGYSASPDGHGVYGSCQNIGVQGFSSALTGEIPGVKGESVSSSGRGVSGTSPYIGVEGICNADESEGYGIYGEYSGSSEDGVAIYGKSTSVAAYGKALIGETVRGYGVYGYVSNGSTGGAGVFGKNEGVLGAGVYGSAPKYGVAGTSTDTSSYGYGVKGDTNSPSGYGVYSSGDFGGTGSKYFIQPHPKDPSKEIRFVCLEGNESGTYFRGSAHLEGGQAVINVPEAFRLVTDPKGLTVQVTPLDLVRICVKEKSLDRIVVVGDGDVEFDYFVNGVRKGFTEFEPIRENHAWVPEFREKPYGTQFPHALRRILVENGTLNPDFTPNEKTAARMGWKLRDFEKEHPELNEQRKREPLKQLENPDRKDRAAVQEGKPVMRRVLDTSDGAGTAVPAQRKGEPAETPRGKVR